MPQNSGTDCPQRVKITLFTFICIHTLVYQISKGSCSRYVHIGNSRKPMRSLILASHKLLLNIKSLAFKIILNIIKDEIIRISYLLVMDIISYCLVS